MGLASNEKTVRAILNATKFGTEPFSAQRFGEEVCYDPDNEMIHLPGEQVVEIIIIGKRMGLFERAGIEQLVNRNPNLTKNLQRILGDYQRSSVSVSQ
ncbi:MAG: hypothetical protein A2905_05565 [Candidatus Levybacteria bacterium RIFCSPLOWO2_01_FULL_36_10]|nr:MAG: hypothetical protein A2905_05565 [Candidatus Levybacteria bacterium RIFCSPLOWO2_01_FULL_36_10]